MKKRIGTKVYDTKTAQLIVKDGRIYYEGDYINGALYMKRTGEFFFVTELVGHHVPDFHHEWILLTRNEASKVEVVADMWGNVDDTKFKEIFV